ncbi:hypothetical protein M6D93_01565 [Jatrophihabitans telluris]|uniref:Uncharacterized protein n=1 Tax=Jatrophihabitans telluris TaxID=2038343 RepID=A0ABY4QYU8_9ACTN|nr:hypothetical protein [Jatrophihabitans telluris]UQX88703.1 hypothetical protein M6D93_01565 [Jatrophihabitans telluris]
MKRLWFVIAWLCLVVITFGRADAMAHGVGGSGTPTTKSNQSYHATAQLPLRAAGGAERGASDPAPGALRIGRSSWQVAPLTQGFVAAESALPKLTGSFADSFAGGSYTTQTFKAGTTFYRAEGTDQGIGSFFGLAKPSTAADAEKMYNLAKWNNGADVVSTYRLTQDTTMYVGDVAGGTGQQALLPRGSGNVFQQVGREPLP